MDQIEYWNLEAQIAHQIALLQKQQLYLTQHSPFYQEQWVMLGLTNVPILSLQDLQQFPTTSKGDIQMDETQFHCIAATAFREYNTTSGTLGKPLSIALSDSDLERLAYNEQLSFECLNVQAGDVVQLMLTLDRQFMAGMAYYAGLRKMGGTIVRTGAGLPQLQWDAIFRHQTKILVAVPSFLLKMIAYAEAHGIDYQNSPVKSVLAIGETLKDGDLNRTLLCDKIRGKWDIQLHSTYAATEMQTGFTECAASCGGHQHTDLIVVEIVDDEGKQVAEGELGEVCITNLGVEAMPLWRYRTGDVAKMYYEPCICGRQSPRISGVVGRKNHLLKLKGTSVYPNAIYEALQELHEVHEYCIEATLDVNGQDDLLIYIHTSEKEVARVLGETQQFLRSKLRIAPRMQAINAIEMRNMQFPEWSRKQIKFVDRRSL